MKKVEISQITIDNKFANAVDWFGAFLPNLISFYALFTKRANNNIKSIRICVKSDITPVFEYNEQWVCEIESHMFNKILAIELYRFLLHHTTHRELSGPNAFIASTCVCNIKELDKFIEGAPNEIIELVRETLIDRKKVEEMLGKKIDDEDFYYEGIYELLNQNQEKDGSGDGDPQNNEQSGEDGDQEDEKESSDGSGSDSEDEQDSNSGSDSDRDGEEDDRESESSSGDGDSDDTDDAQSDNSGSEDEKESSDESDDDTDYGDGSGDGSDESDDSTESDGDTSRGQQNQKKSREQQSSRKNFEDWSNSGEENTEEWGQNSVVDEMIIDTLEHKTKPENWGDLSGEQIEEILLSNKRKVNIGPIINSFKASIRCRNRRSTRLRYNKRYGLVYPGYRYDRKNKVLFAIDSSGSMSEEDIRKGCEILFNFLKKTQIDVAFWDAEMTEPFHYKREIKKIEAPGRGGTNPICIGDWLDEHKAHYDGVIIFTDCYWSWSKKNIDSEIFIISSEEKYKDRIPSFVKHHASIQELTHIFS